MNNEKERYSAVVESGSCSPNNNKRWEEHAYCGHAHKTIEAAQKCGKKNMRDHYYVGGSWQCFSLWNDFMIHNQLGEWV